MLGVTNVAKCSDSGLFTLTLANGETIQANTNTCTGFKNVINQIFKVLI